MSRRHALRARAPRALAATALLSLASVFPLGSIPTAQAAAPLDPTETYVESEILVSFEANLPAHRRVGLLDGVRGVEIDHSAPAAFARVSIPANADPEVVAAELAARPGVHWAEPNYVRHTTAPTCPQDPHLVELPSSPNQWSVFETGLQWLWRRGTGSDSSMVIAIIDTGIDAFPSAHPDLTGRLHATGRDFVADPDDGDPTDAGAFKGHGTAVAGVAGAAANAVGIAGVAYCAELMIVRTMDCSLGSTCPGTVADIAAGIRWAADQGADVINLSLGASTYSQAEREACLYAIKNGAVVVAASGNDSASSVSFPGGYPEVICVGSVNASGDVSSFSNYGPRLDLVAPGDDIWTTDIGGGWAMVDGTSFASPFVAGVAAQVLGRNPSMTPIEVDAYLKRYTTQAGDGSKDGAGALKFFRLTDWSDHAPPVAGAAHENFAWEWLGADASFEEADGHPADEDGRPNITLPGDWTASGDGWDDGTFPLTLSELPFLPKHLLDLGGDKNDFIWAQTVCNPSGPRYGADPSKNLYTNIWVDYDHDFSFESFGPEHEIVSHTENPATWGGHSVVIGAPGVTAWEEHILGLPLMVRTRLTYGTDPSDAHSIEPFGEVEDYSFVNFVETFDTVFHAETPGDFMTGAGWTVVADPQPEAGHHGMWEMASALHPAPGEECNGIIESEEIMLTPDMDWSEYSEGFIQFWYQHGFQPCDEFGAPLDDCRAELVVEGMVVDVLPLPPFSGGTILKNYSMYCGASSVQMRFISASDEPGWLYVDDVMAWAYDAQLPERVTDLALSRTAGDRAVTTDFTEPDENDMSPSPPTEPVANTFDLRYSKDPITNETEFFLATPLNPSDALGAFPVPATPYAARTATFEFPSAFQAYHVAMMVGDEVVNYSPISNDAVIANSPTLAVAVGNAPQDTVGTSQTAEFTFNVANNGNLDDVYEIAVTTTPGGWGGWVADAAFPALMPATIGQAINAGGNVNLTVKVDVPGAAPDSSVEIVTVTATSLQDGSVIAMGTASVLVQSGVVDAPILSADLRAGLEFAGPNPTRGATRLDLALTRPQEVSVQIYDVAGRLVRTLSEGTLEAGRHDLRWEGSDSSGMGVPAGVYFLKARSAEVDRTLRVVRLR